MARAVTRQMSAEPETPAIRDDGPVSEALRNALEPGPVSGDPGRTFSEGDFEEGKFYRVQLKRAVKVGRRTWTPESPLVMEGSAAKQLGIENIANASEAPTS